MSLCTSQHFVIQELVDRATFERFGVSAWWFLQPAALQALDELREFFNRPMICNNWHRNGPFQFRGFRPRSCDVGGEYSQHRLGNAFDLDVQGITAEEARQMILAKPEHPLLQGVTCIETDVNWLHVDFRNCNRIKVVKP